MKFEAIRPYNHKVMMATEYTSCIYHEETLVDMAAGGYTFKINGKTMSVKQVLEYVKANPNERPTGVPEIVPEPEPEVIVIPKPVEVKEPEVPPVTDKVATPVTPNVITTDEPFIVTYTRYIENGKFDKTYDQKKIMKTFDLAKVFIDKKINQKSRFWAGATITDARADQIVYSVDRDYKVDDYQNQ